MFTKRDLINFAKFWYGVDIDFLDEKTRFKCKTVEGAFEYWKNNIYFGMPSGSPKCSHDMIYPSDGSTPVCRICGKKAGELL